MAKTDRNTPSKDITKVAGTAPNFLAQYVEEDTSLDTMNQFVSVPRLKLIQPMTDPQLKDLFGEGTCIVRPGDAVVCKKDETFLFVPQFFFTEWCLWGDRRDKESPAILGRTFDPTSEIAKKAGNKATRFEIYPGQEAKSDDDKWVKRYVQHFCFPGVIYGQHPLVGQAIVLSFERGEIGQGFNFINSIKMRRAEVEITPGESRSVKVPLWAQVWALTVKRRVNDQGNWYGFDFGPPEDAPNTITAEESDAFKAAHLELSRLHEDRRLVVDHGGQDEAVATDPPVDSGKF